MSWKEIGTAYRITSVIYRDVIVRIFLVSVDFSSALLGVQLCLASYFSFCMNEDSLEVGDEGSTIPHPRQGS